ncbi:MAG: M28 family metallopeptidase [Aestuariibacter sp.]
MRKSTIQFTTALLLASAAMTASSATFDEAWQSISEDDLRQHVKTLSSDKFEGRQPTTIGETYTLEYLTRAFTQMGYEPGVDGSFLQPVELLRIEADPNMTLDIAGEKFEYKVNMVAGTSRETEQVSLDDSELVFVGYGVNAPEYGWNDYANVDVKGKTVVILVNDPGFERPDSGKFQGTTMTYYGRWTYKYEEASRQGAAGALIVHEKEPASYGWSVVANSWSGPQYGLVTADGNKSRIAVEGWLSLEAAQQVFAKAGMDFAEEKRNAQDGPYAKAMGSKANITINADLKRSSSYNFLATLPGSTSPQEHIIYTAHWDHLGKDPAKEGDNIYNGAHDNATGSAGLISIAKAFASLEKRPARSVSFLFVTAEEQGLLGSKYYAEHPVYALDKTVANLNIDAMNIQGKTQDVEVVGMGKSELEQYLKKAAARQGRTLVQEHRPAAGYYYRSDHFSLAKKGVPALYAKGGPTPIDEATAQYRKKIKVIQDGCYHQVCDQYRESWDFGGIVEDTQMFFQVGYDIANSDDWPKWHKTSEFQRVQ